MSSIVDAISSELRAKYKVDEFYYPHISMNVQIPEGLKGEISEIVQLLRKNRFETNSLNVFQVMQFKRKLLTRYTEKAEQREILKNYRTLLEKKVKPVGTAIPIELIFADGLIVILLSIIARFGLSFADEAGKIAARKLLDNERRQARRHNMNIDEYRFIKSEAIVWIKKGNTVKSFAKKMQIRKRKKRQS